MGNGKLNLWGMLLMFINQKQSPKLTYLKKAILFMVLMAL